MYRDDTWTRPFFIDFRHEGKAKMMRLYSLFIDARINLSRLYLGLLGRPYYVHPVDSLAKTFVMLGVGDGLHTVFRLEQLRMHMNKKVTLETPPQSGVSVPPPTACCIRIKARDYVE